jgi:hypothetical protein
MMKISNPEQIKRQLRSLFSVKKFLLLVVIYLFIYGPPFRLLPVNISTILAIPAYIYLFNSGELFTSLRRITNELIFLLCIFLYSLIFPIWSGDYSFALSIFTLIFINIPTGIWIYLILKNNNVKRDHDNVKNIVFYLAIAGLIASLITVWLSIDSDLASKVKFEWLKYDEELMRYQMHRGFGLTDELLFSFSAVQGIILLLVLYFFGFNFITAILATLLVFSISVNGRIGLIFMFFIPLLLLRSKKEITYLLIFVLICLLAITIFDGLDSSAAFVQARSFWDEIGSFMSSTDGHSADGQNTISTLLGDMLVFPDTTAGFIFGVGENIFLSESKNSDVGYVILINYGGIILLLLTLGFIFVCILRAISSKKYGFIYFIIIFTFLLFNFKGLFFAPKPGMRFFIIVYLFLIFGINTKFDTSLMLNPKKITS